MARTIALLGEFWNDPLQRRGCPEAAKQGSVGHQGSLDEALIENQVSLSKVKTKMVVISAWMLKPGCSGHCWWPMMGCMVYLTCTKDSDIGGVISGHARFGTVNCLLKSIELRSRCVDVTTASALQRVKDYSAWSLSVYTPFTLLKTRMHLQLSARHETR